MNLQLGQHYSVKVTKIMPRYAVVELSDKTTELIHVSKIANCFVKNISDFISVGSEYDAEGVEGSAHPVELSLRHLDLKSKYKPSVKKYHNNPPEYRNNPNTGSKKLGKPTSFESMLARSESDLKDKMVSSKNRQQRFTKRAK